MAMSPEYLGLILLAALLTEIFVGFPIAFTLIILSVVFGYIGTGPQVFYLMVFQTVGLMKEEILAAVPLFIFMGYVLEQAGLMERLFKGFQLVLAPVRGSLYLGVLLTATLFAAATGIIGASVTVMGLMAAPTMIRSRYDVALSAGAITAGGTLGILIPPSVMLVVLAPVAGISIVKLLAAAVVPGVMLSALYIGYALIRSFLNPRLGPPLPPEERARSYLEMVKELFLGIIPLAFLIFAALGSILAGLATPTEAAAMGALGALVLMLAYRRMTWQRLRQAVHNTLQTSSMVLFLAVASNIYSSVFTRLGTTTLLAETLLELPISPMTMLALLMLVIFILGWPLE
jgi:tripartite ATP-independent transporter DctM subunit